MGLIKRYKLIIIISVLGAAGGFLYWKYIGCLSGSCPIKSVWYLSTMYGTLIGFLVGGLINDLVLKFRKRKSPEDNQDNK